MDLREFQASLIYIVSFKIARAIQRDPGSKSQRAEERRRKGRERETYRLTYSPVQMEAFSPLRIPLPR